MSATEDAERFCGLFPDAYLAYHRRDGPRSELPGASRAVLRHLAQAGPVTIGEATRHLDRSQSVVSEIVTQLEANGFVEREPDPADRRRTLVWLTVAGQERLRRDSDVLDPALVRRAMEQLPAVTRAGLIEGLGALVAAAASGGPNPQSQAKGTPT